MSWAALSSFRAERRIAKTVCVDWRGIALRRNTTMLLGAVILAGLGERLWLGFAPKYLQTLGAGVMAIGLFDALQTLLGALYAYPGGWMTDQQLRADGSFSLTWHRARVGTPRLPRRRSSRHGAPHCGLVTGSEAAATAQAGSRL